MSKVLEHVNRALAALEFLDGIEGNRRQAVHVSVPPLLLGVCKDVTIHVMGVARGRGKTKT